MKNSGRVMTIGKWAKQGRSYAGQRSGAGPGLGRKQSLEDAVLTMGEGFAG